MTASGQQSRPESFESNNLPINEFTNHDVLNKFSVVQLFVNYEKIQIRIPETYIKFADT